MIPATADLSRLVLQQEDVGDGYIAFDVGPIALGDVEGGPRADLQRFDRAGGHKARYRLLPDAETGGPLVVVSMVDLFETRGGAQQDLQAYGQQAADAAPSPEDASARGGASAPGTVLGIGEASMTTTLLQEGGEFDVRYYTIAWQFGNATASVSVQGFEGEVSLDDALELARKQQARLEAAAAPSAAPS